MHGGVRCGFSLGARQCARISRPILRDVAVRQAASARFSTSSASVTSHCSSSGKGIGRAMR